MEVTSQADPLRAVVTVVALYSLSCRCPVPVLCSVVTVVALESLSCQCPVLVLFFCVSFFLVIASLTVTLSCLCLLAVSFRFFFHQIPFFVCCKKEYQYCNHVFKYIYTKCILTLHMNPLSTIEFKNYEFS